MSYARAFQDIFDSIFRTGRYKPRIRKAGFMWICTTPDGKFGWGESQQAAYLSWKADPGYSPGAVIVERFPVD